MKSEGRALWLSAISAPLRYTRYASRALSQSPGPSPGRLLGETSGEDSTTPLAHAGASGSAVTGVRQLGFAAGRSGSRDAVCASSRPQPSVTNAIAARQ